MSYEGEHALVSRLVGAYRRTYTTTPFIKRLTGYIAAALVVYAYGKPVTALVVLGTLIVTDVVLTLFVFRGKR